MFPRTDGRMWIREVTTWTGDPRGRWDGDTLVVDSTNYHDRGWLSTHAGSGRLRGTPNSTALHIVERFTMIDQNTIQYEMTVDDPQTFTQPWRASLLLNRSEEYRIYEYACHEGNAAIELVLRGARAEEKAEAAESSRSRRAPSKLSQSLGLRVHDEPAIAVKVDVLDRLESGWREPCGRLLFGHDHRRIVFVRALVRTKVDDGDSPAWFQIEGERGQVTRAVCDVVEDVVHEGEIDVDRQQGITRTTQNGLHVDHSLLCRFHFHVVEQRLVDIDRVDGPARA